MSDNEEANVSAEMNTARIARDYAVMRLEHISESSLVGFIEQDFIDLEKEFHDAQIKVLLTSGPQQRSSEYVVSRDFVNRLKAVQARLRLSLQQVDVKPVEASSSLNVAHLPKIAIKTFTGKLEDWVGFKELFDSLIHRRSISNVEKLHYLLSSVQGAAYDLVKGFPLSEDNYINAYETLCKHYDKKRQIAIVYYEKLLNCEPVKNKTDLDRVFRTFSENLNILSKFKLPDENFMLYYLLWSKLDVCTREAFELQLDSNVDIPDFENLQSFIEKRSQALENSNLKLKVLTPTHKIVNKNKSSLIVPAAPNLACPMCAVIGHDLVKCPSFLDLKPTERYSKIKESRLCILCLKPSHNMKVCKSSVRCAKCKYRHHTLLHFDKVGEDSQGLKDNSQLTTLSVPSCHNQVLFSTAVVRVKNSNGQLVPIRILFDSGSACNFLTLAAANRLGLPLHDCNQSINGIGVTTTATLGSVSCEIFPARGACLNKYPVEAFVLPQICSDMPSGPIDISTWDHFKNLVLADPRFFEPGPIDMLVNVSFLSSVLQPGLVKGESGHPIAINTVFGWLIMGECAVSTNYSRCRSRDNSNGAAMDCHLVSSLSQDNNSKQFAGIKNVIAPQTAVSSCHFRDDSCLATKDCLLVSSLSLDNNIRRFWEVENVVTPKSAFLSKDDLSCENLMGAAYYRNPEGRMVVPLTFENPQNKPWFLNSREIALKRFLNLERKFNINPQFRTAYVNFMNDYLESGHMEVVEAPPSSEGPFYYIPHHGILRPDSISTPLRTVYDASAKDSEGRSLNATLLPGPKLQKNIFDLLLRFRWHAVVFTGDIKQMYRQFLVDRKDCDYQRILWRPSPADPVQDFRLLTVTYGVSCAPYQALWCISKLAHEFVDTAPLGASVLDRDTYVDDIVSGADSEESAVHIRNDLIKILSSARLHLRKWTSNSPGFLQGLPDSDLYSEQFRNFEDVHDVSLKILGLLWLPKSDTFSFKTTSLDCRCTKRSILSDIARIFDPLGFLSPVVFMAKYLMQLLWSAGLHWDEDVPERIAEEWLKLKSQLSCLSSLSIPRRMIDSFHEIQFHGYCDASERGYCAVVYCRVVKNDQEIIVRLCCAKSKVAPLRRLSIPRLELLAAVLLSDLVSAVHHALKDFRYDAKIYAWSDSTVVLTWIKSCPSRWKTFVANRTALIQERIAPDCWHHVSTNDNPADHGSRGLLPADLVQCESWWAGPAWLLRSERNWPRHFTQVDGAALEEEKVLTLFSAMNSDFIDKILSRFSSFRRIVNILAYCFRYLHNLKNPSQKITSRALLSDETNSVTRFLVKHVQEHVFATEIRMIHKGATNSLHKPLRKLCPFVDREGLLRVGGRLSRSETFNYDRRHPMLLPREHRLTALVIEEYHRRFSHPGLQTLQNLISQDFWILSSKRAINAITSSCLKCYRVRPQVASPPLMGDLPAFRVSQLKPFSSSAVDYAGPFNISLGRARGSKSYKGYICVFVCTATKAVHLELVSELTSEAYLAALRRFIARRGRCSRLVSDQGRNFVGANNILKELMSEASQKEQIEFVFNPPGSPHFSGLAEAGVKSVKTHLSRIIGLQRLTFEEFYTVLTQVEALLNSRPLSPLSSDPNDLTVLTPGHFLTLEPLSILPEPVLTEVKVSPLQRWKLLQQMHQHFWRKWHLEYLHTLQQRNKWSTKGDNLQVGTMVLIVNEQCSPLKWNLGRIIKLHPGSDGVCRVVTIRTATGEYKRPVVKLCLLPFRQ